MLVNQNVGGVALPGVVETTTGGTNVHFASAALLGDSNLLSNAIQGVVLGSEAGVALHTSRQAGIVAERMDMDLSQFPADVSPAGGGGGSYDKLIPILQQWKTQYNFVGSYYINIGDKPSATGADNDGLDEEPSLLQSHRSDGRRNRQPFLYTPYQSACHDGGRDHHHRHAGRLNSGDFGRFAIFRRRHGGHGSHRSQYRREHASHGGVRQHLDPQLCPGGYGPANLGVLGDIPPGTTLTFGIPTENTNFLQTATDVKCNRPPSPTTMSSISRS